MFKLDNDNENLWIWKILTGQLDADGKLDGGLGGWSDWTFFNIISFLNLYFYMKTEQVKGESSGTNWNKKHDNIKLCWTFHVCNCGFVMKHNWQKQMQNHWNKCQLTNQTELLKGCDDDCELTCEIMGGSLLGGEIHVTRWRWDLSAVHECPDLIIIFLLMIITFYDHNMMIYI